MLRKLKRNLKHRNHHKYDKLSWPRKISSLQHKDHPLSKVWVRSHRSSRIHHQLVGAQARLEREKIKIVWDQVLVVAKILHQSVLSVLSRLIVPQVSWDSQTLSLKVTTKKTKESIPWKKNLKRLLKSVSRPCQILKRQRSKQPSKCQPWPPA